MKISLTLQEVDVIIKIYKPPFAEEKKKTDQSFFV